MTAQPSRPAQALILCGGRGARAHPATEELPKPLLPVGGTPILEHVMRIYARHGVTRFVLATGHLGGVIGKWVADLAEPWDVVVRDTGVDSGTGDRVSQCRGDLDESFHLTYGDGLGNIDIAALVERHRSHRGVATVTTVPLRSQYGTLALSASDQVLGFREKPVIDGEWINAGFFVMSRDVFDDWRGEDLEAEVLPALATSGQLFAYRHDGFWKSLDTHKDQAELTRLAQDGVTPWLPS